MPHASRPPWRAISSNCCSAVSGIPFSVVSSLKVPVRVPSMLAPLSPQIQMTRVSSSSPMLVDGVEEASDVPVGVLLVAGVHLHLPGIEPLLVVVEGVPRREGGLARRRALGFAGEGVSSASGG